jgi:O-antigen/teichoic acid export membrane protein
MTHITPEAPLAGRVFAGVLWLTVQGSASKFVVMVGQIILAWFLGPQEFGLMALAYTVAGFASLIQQAGFRETLIYRQSDFHLWVNPIFWLSLVCGLLAGLLMVIIAPLAALLYGLGGTATLGEVMPGPGRDQVADLITIIAIAAPLNSLAIVPTAYLQTRMRFKALALMSFFQTVLTLGLSIYFATRGYGAFSFALPLPISAAANTILLWILARPWVGLNPQVDRWRDVLRNSGKLLLAGFFFQITLQGGAIMLGLFNNDDVVVGLFSFAFVLSLQTTQLLTQSLGSVMFPALSKLQNEPLRQRMGFLRAVKSLALVGVPLCLLQAAVAQPLLQLLFGTRWQGAIESLQVLSIGMGLQLANASAINFLLAQGRFGVVLITSMFCAVVFAILVTIGALAGGALSVSLAVAIYVVVIGQFCLYVPVRLAGGGWTDTLPVYLKPLLLATLAVGCGWLGAMVLPSMPGRNLAVIVVSIVVAVLIYLPLIHLAARAELNDLLSQLAGFVRRVRIGSGA